MKKKNKNKKTKKTKIMLHVDGYMSSLKTLKSMIEKKKSCGMVDCHMSIFLFFIFKKKKVW